MAQLAGKRPYPATLPNDFEVAHECDVRYLRTPFNLKSYAEPDVDYVRAISQIADMENENSGATLKGIHKRSKLSLDAIAKKAGYAGKSSIQRYFDGTFRGHLRMEVADKLAAAFAGTPVDPQEIYDLAGVQYRPRDPNRQSAGLWRPREDTIRLALATARKSLSQSCVTESDLQALVRAVTSVVQFAANNPAKEDSPGFPDMVVGIVATAVQNYTPPPAPREEDNSDRIDDISSNSS